MPETEDLYEILHLHPSAHPDVVQAAYRRLALLYHPDKNPSPEATEMMAAVNRAYAVLSDPEQRAKYDRSRASQTSSADASSPSAASASQASRPQSSAPRNPTEYFTLGSTKSEVAKVQGVPTNVERGDEFDSEKWEYDILQTVDFDQGRVTGWMDFSGDLRIRLAPGTNTTSKDYFEIGDQYDDVVRLQGTPPMVISGVLWFYEGSSVEFFNETGRVSKYDNSGGDLNIRETKSPHWISPDGVQSNRPPTNREYQDIFDNSWRTLGSDDNYSAILKRDISYPEVAYNLIVRFQGGELDIYINWRDEITYSETTNVNYQIDNGPVWRQSWHVSIDRMATFMPAQDIAETIRALFDAETFTVQVYQFGGNPLTASFQVSGFREAVGPVLEAWRRTGSRAPGAATQGGGGCFLLPATLLSGPAVAVPAVWFLL